MGKTIEVPKGATAKGAVMSEDKLYRYSLFRAWGPGRRILFVMLNPSTADHETDDPTIRRLMGFARGWGYDGVNVVNLYAFRTKDPKLLWYADDPVGPANDYLIEDAAAKAATDDVPVVLAWGGNALEERAEEVIDIINETGARMFCLSKTKGGHPGHPLYIKADQELIPWTL